jgi:hypothetical protein
MAAEKYKNKVLAQKLFPVFLQHGTLEAVFRHCNDNGEKLTKPTISRMANYFGWKKLKAAAHQNQFAAAPINGDPIADVNAILQEQKQELYKAMKAAPLNLDYHKALGTCLGLIMKNEELKITANLTPRRIAENVLEQLVEWLGGNGNTEVAHELSALLPLFARERL